MSPLESTPWSLTLVVEGDVDVVVEEFNGVGPGSEVDEDEAGVGGNGAGVEVMVTTSMPL